MLPELRKHFPVLQLELREAVTASLVEDAASGRLDAFIAALPLEHPGLVTEELFPDRFFLAVPSGDPAFASPPVPPESPALERLMLLEEGHCLREQALAVCGSVRPVAMASYGATSLTTLLQMVAHVLASLRALREGLTYESLIRLQTRYRAFFAIIGIAMLTAALLA